MMRVVLGLLAVGLSVATGCSPATGSRADRNADREVLVFAAASLSEAFAVLEDTFEADHPDVDVVVHVAGSQRLAAQILEGAPADVFAAADTTQMQRVVEAGMTADDPRVLAHNTLALAVAPGNPHAVTGPSDLARDDLVVVLAEEAVPIGAYTRQMLRRAGITVTPASLELDVRAVLSRVALGEADVGVVYASDLQGRTDVASVAVPAEVDVTAEYPIATLQGSGTDADAFLELALSDRGAATLRSAGFGTP